jgi:uncharacterized DUF497 family protein
MAECRIVWDEHKNAENKLKHKIGFEDAQFVFADPDRIERIDHSESSTSGETRWQTIGRVGSLLFVVYTECGKRPRSTIPSAPLVAGSLKGIRSPGGGAQSA